MRAKEQVFHTEHLPARVTGKDGKTYPAKRNYGSKAERVEAIRNLAAHGFFSSQIASRVGICVDRVKILAKESGIALADAGLRIRRIDVNRVISETVMAAESLSVGLDLIDRRLPEADMSQIDGWIQRLCAGRNGLNSFITKLRRTANHGEQNGREIRQENRPQGRTQIGADRKNESVSARPA
jgi:hypothetical protein